MSVNMGPATSLVCSVAPVPDPDAAFATATAAGARQVHAVADAYGWRLGRVVDPFGHHRESGRPLASS